MHACLRWTAGIAVSFMTVAAQAGGLSKIRVAPDGRGFVNERGRAFVPFGVTYYRPNTGWAPQVWKEFDAQATRQDFARMKKLHINCVRVFLSYGSFYKQRGQLDQNGLAKFDQFLTIAEQAGIYVHPTGPDMWEGPPDWSAGGIEDESTLAALEAYWKLFAARYAGRPVIFAYDLRNEPSVGWNGLEAKWGGKIPGAHDPRLLEFQHFREGLADEWTRRQVAAIKAVDPAALVTVGMIQWSVPTLLGSVEQYSGFNPARQARYLDYLTVHFYPLEDGGYKYKSPESLARNLSYLEGVVRAIAACGKPAVLGEFGWYGGGIPTFSNGQFPPASQAQQAEYDQCAVEISRPYVCGWLNWGLYDDPQARDCSELIGLVTDSGKTKEWGKAFRKLAAQYERRIPPSPVEPRPELDWAACLTNTAAENAYRKEYHQSFIKVNTLVNKPSLQFNAPHE